MFKNILIFLFCSTLFASPEDDIIIIDNFVSNEISSALIRHHKSENEDLKRNSYNTVSFNYSSPPKIQKIARRISKRILNEMKKHYGISKELLHVTHALIFARTIGNICPYHSDNIKYVCPIHGDNPPTIRKKCSESCMGSFEPNHTPFYDYTAVLYLNEDFEGGEIVLEDGPFNKIYRKKIPIKKNRLVLFPNGPEYYHEVLRITEGTRYNVLFWYTNDPNYTHRVLK